MIGQDQQHPQYIRDRKVVDSLKEGKPNDYNLAELARLLIRYQGFPGARDIKEDLQKTLQRWGMNEEQLYETTRNIHAKGQVYKTKGNDSEDWA